MRDDAAKVNSELFSAAMNSRELHFLLSSRSGDFSSAAFTDHENEPLSVPVQSQIILSSEFLEMKCFRAEFRTPKQLFQNN